MNTNHARRGGRARSKWVRVSTLLAAAALIAFGASSCVRQLSAAGPSGSSTASSSPASKPSATWRPSASPTATKKPTTRASSHGNIKQHAKTHKIAYRKRVPLTRSASFQNGIAVSVTHVRSVTSQAVGPGQVGGPALALTVKIKNGSKAALDLSTVTVNLSGSKGVPGILATGAPYDPLTGSLADGESTKGTYVFTIAKADRKPITVQVQYGSGRTVLQFSGNA